MTYWAALLSSFLLFGFSCARCPEIVSREEWGAIIPEEIQYIVFPVDYVIIQHSVTPTCHTKADCMQLVANIQDFNLPTLGDIAYNFLVGGDGRIYEGRGWHIQGAHTYGYNTRSMGLGFIGNFNNDIPTESQLQAAKDLLQCGIEKGELTTNYKLYGARQVGETESPGRRLYNKIQYWPHFARLKT